MLVADMWPMLAVSSLRGLVGVGMLAAVVTTGCASETETDATDDVGTASESALVGANEDFDAKLRDLESIARRCEVEGHCQSDGALQRATLGPRAFSFPRLGLCDVLRPFAALESPYVFVGASVKEALIDTVDDGGVDVVFDLARRQLAVFSYKNHGVQNLMGVEASAYFGYAFGKKMNVLDAWSGEFQSAEATVETPILNLSVGGAIFRSPDNSVWGALVQGSVGLNALGPLASVEIAVSEGHWTAWDKATEALGKSYWFVTYRPARAAVGHGEHTYLQFANGRDEGLALVQTLGPLGLVPAAQAIALEALQNRDLTIAKACAR